jgi:hypothetical protein
MESSEPAADVDPSTLPQPPADDPLVRANALYFEGQPLTEVRSAAGAVDPRGRLLTNPCGPLLLPAPYRQGLLVRALALDEPTP